MSEIIGVAMAVVLAPFTVTGFRASRMPGKAWFVTGYAVMVTAYVLSIAEGWATPTLFDQLEHVGYALSGICFAVGSWTVVARERGWAPR